jgi:signal transduction histidine kinase
MRFSCWIGDARDADDYLVKPDRLVVRNTARSLTAADAERMFERFWRSDTARSAGTHAGLGLALSRKLGAGLAAEVDNGELTVALRFAAPGSSSSP